MASGARLSYGRAMRLRRLLATVPAALVLAGPPAIVAPAAAAELCDNTYGGDVIYAYGDVSCRHARKVVRTWGYRAKADGIINRTVLRYRCRGKNDPYEGLIMRCSTSWAQIRFYANTP